MIRALIACAAAFALIVQPVVASAAKKRKPAIHKTVRKAPRKTTRKSVRAAPAKRAVPATQQIGFTVVSEGKGASPGPEDVVLISYIGRLADGTVFDQDGDAVFPMADMIVGFRQALQRMKRGGSYHVTIPPLLGYGVAASGPIPANATLTFDIMLFEFKTKAEVEAIRQQDKAATPPARAPAAP